jgi:hypothetical protein
VPGAVHSTRHKDPSWCSRTHLLCPGAIGPCHTVALGLSGPAAGASSVGGVSAAAEDAPTSLLNGATTGSAVMVLVAGEQ